MPVSSGSATSGARSPTAGMLIPAAYQSSAGTPTVSIARSRPARTVTRATGAVRRFDRPRDGPAGRAAPASDQARPVVVTPSTPVPKGRSETRSWTRPTSSRVAGPRISVTRDRVVEQFDPPIGQLGQGEEAHVRQEMVRPAPERADDRQRVGASAERRPDRQLGVRLVLGRGSDLDRDAARPEPIETTRGDRVEVTDDEVRPDPELVGGVGSAIGGHDEVDPVRPTGPGLDRGALDPVRSPAATIRTRTGRCSARPGCRPTVRRLARRGSARQAVA